MELLDGVPIAVDSGFGEHQPPPLSAALPGESETDEA
jgi:hypothetical protein